MITYTVHEPPDAPGDLLDRAEALVFVKDGFSWVAAAFGPFWMAANRLWLGLVGYLAVYGLLLGIFWALGIGQRPLSYALLALGAIVGFEADTLKRWTLERSGWRMIGSVNGRNSEECERRFFEAWLPGQPYVAAAALSQSRLAETRQAATVPAPESAPAQSVPPIAQSNPGSGWRSAIWPSRQKGR